MSTTPVPQAPDRQVILQPSTLGTVTLAPPTFLERWGVLFLACAGLWILFVSTGILIYFLRHQPAAPSLSGLTPDQARETLNTFRQLVDQWRDALTYVFDLMVTKTVLPIVTLLLGYLFGKKS